MGCVAKVSLIQIVADMGQGSQRTKTNLRNSQISAVVYRHIHPFFDSNYGVLVLKPLEGIGMHFAFLHLWFFYRNEKLQISWIMFKTQQK